MKYNIIGDVHGNKNWKKLFIDDGETVNVFVGDYFSPYSVTTDFETAKNVFLDIIEAKKKNPDRVVLLIGNHDFDHWKFNDMCTRHDYKHEEEIRTLFETFDDCFQIAYNIDNKAIVTHAGISILWYVRWFLDERFSKGKKAFEPDTKMFWLDIIHTDHPHYDGKTYREIIDDNFDNFKKSVNNNFNYIFDTGKEYILYNYDTDTAEPLKVDVETVCNALNSTWREKYYRYSFDECGTSYDDATSPSMSPTWFRDNCFSQYNLFKYADNYCIVGHTRHHHVEKIAEKIWNVDVLCYSIESLLIDTEKEDMFSIQKKDKQIYLSGPISGHIEEMLPVFRDVKEELMRECGASYVWSPMENISTDTSWSDAMLVCEDVLATKDFDEIRIIIIKDWTKNSKGVKRELEIAKERHIPVYGLEVIVKENRNIILL